MDQKDLCAVRQMIVEEVSMPLKALIVQMDQLQAKFDEYFSATSRRFL